MLNSPIEIAMVFGVALLVFGPKKLPELGRSLGMGIGNFKKSLQEAQEEVKNAINTEPAPKAVVDNGTIQPVAGEPIAAPGQEIPAGHTATCCGGSHGSAK